MNKGRSGLCQAPVQFAAVGMWAGTVLQGKLGLRQQQEVQCLPPKPFKL